MPFDRIVDNSFISVWIEQNDSAWAELMHCVRCGKPIIEYKGTVVTLVPGDSPSKLPFVSLCKGSRKNAQGMWVDCRTKYKFHIQTKKNNL